MKLYHSATSPFVRQVTTLIAEAGISGVELIPVAGTPVDPGTLPIDRNPLGKIPALITDDGQTLYDSRVICRYLDATYDAGLYPAGPRLWQTLVLEATADGMLEAALLMVYENRLRPEDQRFSPWVRGQWQKIERALDTLERDWIDHLAGPLDMGQIAVGCALGYLDFRLSALPWRAAHPDLAAWEAAFSARPAMAATVPVPAG